MSYSPEPQLLMQLRRPIDGTERLPAEEASVQHTLHLAGTFVGQVRVLVRAQIRIDVDLGCVLKLAVRSHLPAVARLVADCIN